MVAQHLSPTTVNPLSEILRRETDLTVADVTTGNACAATISPTTVLNQTKPSTHVVTLNADPTCSNSKVNVTVTSPGGVQSVFSYQIP